MATELLKRASFRYKLYVAVVISVVILLWIGNHARKTTSTSKSLCTQAATLLDLDISGVINNPLDILYVEDNLPTLDQKDSQLIQYTRVKYLNPPSKLPYSLDIGGNHRDEFSGWVADFFKNKRDGIFIEAGANAGESESHTLYLEMELGWTGVLIECNPSVVPYLKSKHRKAWVADVCLSPTKTPGTLNFSNPESWSPSGTLGKAWDIPVPSKWTHFEVQTIPLYTVLAALGWNEVDFFSFDIEGQELNVLRNFPFDLVMFKVLIIEVYFYNATEKAELDRLLGSKGYVFVKDFQVDKVYVHENFQSMVPPLEALTD